jgi:hypothetical protein
MTEGKIFKRRVRERMSKTGERYTTARRQVAAKRERTDAARARLSGTGDRMSDAKVRDATGKTWDEWFRILDRWGAKERTHTETTRYLSEEHGVPGWWTQTLTVYYQRERGLRLKHQQADGFAVSASKTIGVPVEELFDAFVDARRRRRWLTDATMRLRVAQPGRSARFDWGDGSTRVVVGFVDKGPSKSMAAVQHERLPDADEAETTKARWRERLGELKVFLES